MPAVPRALARATRMVQMRGADEGRAQGGNEADAPFSSPVAYHMTQPPSTINAWPVMYRASSDARNTAALPMSSGVCSHFIGTMSVTRFSKTWRGVIPVKAGLVAAMCAASFCQKSVHSTPGQMAFTVIRCAANSLATMRVNVMTPCLATLYGGIVSAERGPAIEAMLMIRPAFRSMKYGATALQVRKTDFVLTANVRSQSSSVLLVKGSPGGDAMPALFTRMSMRPSVSRAR